ncbi:MAG TPA: TldD/PmbA family protein [Actinomycetota bacterium]|nr:TldD/PmbA family protein [Actinomycetota bacterium]
MKIAGKSDLITHDEARSAASAVLDYPGADDIEVMVSASLSGLTRYANSQIIQNTVRNELRATVRAVIGDRAASATTTQLDPEHLALAAGRAVEAARASLPDADFPGLPSPADVGQPEAIMRFDDATASASPAQRSQAVSQILAAAGSDNTAGIYETGAHGYGIFSSAGVDCFDAFTRCNTTCLVDLGDATGWGEASSHAIDAVDHEESARRARSKADAGHDAVDTEPGHYEVVLEAPAVAMLAEFLAYTGFGAKQMIEGESFLSTKQGEKVAAESVTIGDDARHENSVGIGFDFEGVPKMPVNVIEAGLARDPVTDLRTARKLGTTSTGHASGSNEFGPFPFNIVMRGGTASLEDLIGGVADGMLVTRFHYVNILDRPATLLTGMTRDGTFRIRDGAIAEPVRNFRFAQSVLDALAGVIAVGKDLASIAPDYSSFGSTVAPALRIADFNFASKTSH